MTLRYACIAPHGTELIPRLASSSSERKFLPTRKGIRQLARNISAARPHSIIVASPHNLRLAGKIGIVVAENSTGVVNNSRGKSVKLTAKCDTGFARELLKKAVQKGLPVVGANYGTSEGLASNMPMDWGTLVPLWFPIKEQKLKPRILIVTPSREIPLSENLRFGKVIAALAEKSRKRLVFVASADQAHTHLKSGPYGFSKAASKYDQLVCEAIAGNKLSSLLDFDGQLVEAAKPDSLWQLAMLAGVTSVIGMRPTLYSYNVPTYYGMICAGFERNS